MADDLIQCDVCRGVFAQRRVKEPFVVVAALSPAPAMPPFPPGFIQNAQLHLCPGCSGPLLSLLRSKAGQAEVDPDRRPAPAVMGASSHACAGCGQNPCRCEPVQVE